MSVLAKDAQPGLTYRLTRDPGQSYYVFCTTAQVRAITKRIARKNVRTMTADDLRLSQAIALCSEKEHVLATRFTRYIDSAGQRRETRAYIAFPPDYQLREVAKPPGYGTSKRTA